MDLRRPGIYCITNKINGKIYIGSSANIKSRWKSHRSSTGSATKTVIGRAIRKYGASNFHFGVLEFCDKKDLIVIEQEWLDSAQPFGSRGYNVSKIAHPVLGAIAALQKKVFQVDTVTGNVIATFESIKSAAKALQVRAHTIEAVVQGKNSTSGGYLWITDPNDARPVKAGSSTYKRPVNSYLPSGEFIKTYESARQAARELNISNTSILRVCSGKKKTVKGLVWRYASDC